MKILLNKYFLLLISILVSFNSLKAQEARKYGFELSEYLKTIDKNELVPLLVEGDAEQLPSIVKQYNGAIRLQVGNLFSLEIPSQNVHRFSLEKAVKLIEFSLSPGKSMSDTMLIQTNVDSIIKQYAPLKTSYTGKGVVLGVIDSGIELAHEDFKDSTGNTRVLFVWDQGVAYNPARQALNYTYGVQWDSAAINAGISTHDDKAAEFGHGSNVTGAAASNGLATGFFRGVAPEVNIITVATDFRKPNWLQTVAESVDYIYRKADSLGMPCVINASVGTYIGSHDGKDIAARLIDALINQKAGRAFVCAAGNAGDQNFHVRQEPNNDTNFTWFENEPSQWSGLGGYYYEVWSDTNDFNNVQFSIGADREVNGNYSFRGRTVFDGIQNRLNTIYVDSIMNSNGDKLATINTYAEESQGRYKLEIAIIDPDSANYLYRFETIGSGKLDIWSSFGLFRHNNMRKSNLPTTVQFPSIANYVEPDSNQTLVSSFTCLPSAITVGNYTNRATYTDVSGTARSFNVTPGEIASNSSLGPNRNGYVKPDVVSAGDFMFGSGRLATLATAIQSNPSKVSHDSLHFRNGGTSMSSPTVAGLVALYLQQCPKASNNQIKTDLIASSKSDQFTASLPNNMWGNGKVDGFQLLKRQVFSVPNPIILPNLCDGDSVTLNLSPFYSSYLWNTGDTVNSITVKQTGNYTAVVENGFGCLSPSDTAHLNFNPIPAKPTISQNGDVLSVNANGFYQWYYNQTQLLGQMNAGLLAQNSGDYYCIFTDNNGCSISTDTITVLITGIDEMRSGQIKISPNPSNGNLFISLENIDFIERFELFAISGKKVWESIENSNKQHYSINLSHLNSGIYFLKIKSNSSTIIKKLIIE